MSEKGKRIEQAIQRICARIHFTKCVLFKTLTDFRPCPFHSKDKQKCANVFYKAGDFAFAPVH
jgi:hypothetical protein